MDEELLTELELQLRPKGLSLVTLYKICEGSETGTVKADKFLETVRRLKLPLVPSQLARLPSVFDEDSSGLVRSQDYIETLQSCGLAADSAPPYGQECTAKLVGVLIRKSIESAELFRRVADRVHAGQKVTTKDLAKEIDTLGAGMYRREVRGIMRHLDPTRSGKVDREDFLLVCKSAEALWHYRVQAKKRRRVTGKTGSPAKTAYVGQLPEIVKKMEGTSMSVGEFVDLIGKETSVTLPKFVNKLRSYYPALAEQEALSVAHAIPSAAGLILGQSVYETLNKFHSERTGKPINVYFQMLVSHIKESGTEIEMFLRKRGVRLGGAVGFEAFKRLIDGTLKLDSETCEKMWKSLRPDGRNECDADEFLQVLQSYEAPPAADRAEPKEKCGTAVKAIPQAERSGWVRRLDNALLERKVAPAELFGGEKSAVEFDVLARNIRRVLPASVLSEDELQNVVSALMGDGTTTRINQQDLLLAIQRSRRSSEKEDAKSPATDTVPTYGNIVYSDMIKTSSQLVAAKSATPSIMEITQKLTPKVFCEFMIERLKWDLNGTIRGEEFHAVAGRFFRGTLTAAEVDSFAAHFLGEDVSDVGLKQLIRFYDEQLHSPAEDPNVTKMDLLDLRAGFVSSGRPQVEEYLRDLGVMVSQRVSQKAFAQLLRKLGATTRGIRRLCEYFAGRDEGTALISIQSFANALAESALGLDHKNLIKIKRSMEPGEQRKPEVFALVLITTRIGDTDAVQAGDENQERAEARARGLRRGIRQSPRFAEEKCYRGR